jgi:hypothetical protein
MGLTRRHFIQYLLGLPLLPSLTLWPRESEARLLPPGKTPLVPSRKIGPENSIGQFFRGEELVYEAGFWMIRRAALGRLSFKAMDKKGYYTATLQGETLGVLGWVSRYRVDTYRSVMEEIDGGKALRAVSFEEDVKVGDKIRKWTHLFDYQRRTWTSKRLRRNGLWAVQEKEIPPGRVYDDFVTAFYNFRYGVYGPLERGQTYNVATKRSHSSRRGHQGCHPFWRRDRNAGQKNAWMNRPFKGQRSNLKITDQDPKVLNPWKPGFTFCSLILEYWI